MATVDSRTYATGKRKTAIARIWLKAGSGVIVVNDLPVDQYFERETSRMVLRQALELIEAQDQFDEKLRTGFTPALAELEGLGYPGITDPRLVIRNMSMGVKHIC